jgi:L-amino acid N-acyltransferase YncA
MVIIRDAADADLPAIVDMLNVEIAQSLYVYAETPVTLDERRVWLETHRAANLPVIVAANEADAAAVGWGALSPYRTSSGYRFTAELSVYVSRAMQRRGTGSAIVQELIARAEARGIRAVVGSVDAENTPSLDLLGTFGFAEVARLPAVGYKFGQWRTQLLVLRHSGRAP